MLKSTVGAKIVERLTVMRVVLDRVVVSWPALSPAPLVASLAGGDRLGRSGKHLERR